MKAPKLILLTLALASAVPAQSPAGAGAAPDVSVSHYTWRREARNPAMDADPMQANDAQRDWALAQSETSRQNAVRQRDGRDILPPPTSTSVDPRISTSEDNEASKMARARRRAPGEIYVDYVYEVKVGNTGAKTIKALVWDYVLSQPETGKEVGKHRFSSRVNIRPGKTRKLIERSLSPPSRVVEAGKAGKQSRGQYTEAVFIRRIEYDDGSVWQGDAN